MGILQAVKNVTGRSQALAVIAALALLVLSAPVASAGPSYTFTSIDFPGSLYSSLDGINDRGQIVGTYSGPSDGGRLRGFLLNGGSFTTIDFFNHTTLPLGINNHGHVVGFGMNSYGPLTGFLLRPGSIPSVFPETRLRGINDSGQMVGDSPAGNFILSGGQISVFSEQMQVIGINNDGQVVGSLYSHGFLLSGGNLNIFDVPGALGTWASGNNDKGQIVGCFTNDGFTTHGFLLSESRFTALDVPGSTVTCTEDINNAGQVVGFYWNSDGQRHGFLATVPVPSTLLLLGSGLAGLVFWRRIRRKEFFNAATKAMRRRMAMAVIAVLALLMLSVPRVASAGPSYTFTTIDVPGARSTTAYGINDHGQIVGGYDFRGFLFSEGKFTTISAFGYGTSAQGINNHGRIVGWGFDTVGQIIPTEGFLLSGGSITIVRGGGRNTHLYGINDSGQIVGQSSSLGSFILSGGEFSVTARGAHGINDVGQIVGTLFLFGVGRHGFLLDEGSLTIIDVPGAVYTDAYGINDSGQIVGCYVKDGRWHGFLLGGGNFTTIDVPGSINTCVNDINNAGQIVGAYEDYHGPPHGFLATVPVPSTLLLLGAGLAGLVFWRRIRC